MGTLTEQQQKVSALLKKAPLIISGPCSAETEEQVMATARGLAATGKVDIMRAGIWKPRTRPGSFEGIGTKGLPWLQQAKKETGMPVAVEVATAKQVEDALHFDVDVLWVGARTTVNPFSVQEIDFDGLIIESHVDPDNAWSDAKQQITPDVLKSMLESMHWRKEDVQNEDFHSALEKFRQQINQLDDELLQVLSTRMKVAQKIGEYKKNNEITILQTNRWNEILDRAVSKGNKLGLSDEFVTKYMDAVHMESINHQNKIMNS